MLIPHSIINNARRNKLAVSVGDTIATDSKTHHQQSPTPAHQSTFINSELTVSPRPLQQLVGSQLEYAFTSVTPGRVDVEVLQIQTQPPPESPSKSAQAKKMLPPRSPNSPLSLTASKKRKLAWPNPSEQEPPDARKWKRAKAMVDGDANAIAPPRSIEDPTEDFVPPKLDSIHRKTPPLGLNLSPVRFGVSVPSPGSPMHAHYPTQLGDINIAEPVIPEVVEVNSDSDDTNLEFGFKEISNIVNDAMKPLIRTNQSEEQVSKTLQAGSMIVIIPRRTIFLQAFYFLGHNQDNCR